MIAVDVKRALDSGLYYAALTTTLTIPHVCAALEDDNGRAEGKEYKDWCRRYVCAALRVDPEVIYSVRCGVLHQGQASVKPTDGAKAWPPPVRRMMFVLPGTKGTYHGNQANETLQFSLAIFCDILTDGMKAWFDTEGQTANVKRNLPNLIQYRPDGMGAFITGGEKIPVLA